ncbi:MAG: hypothetical protein OEQ13_08645, partial [Acidobacteriota bacterium]|nr:hypothetical protein [Acidobacteriota bacterium]
MNIRGIWRAKLVTCGLLVAVGMLAPALAQNIDQITDHRIDFTGPTSITDDGAFVYGPSSTNQLGANPDHRYQIFKFDTATGTATQITSFPNGVSPFAVDYTVGRLTGVSDDGTLLAFVSRSDPLGTNSDEGPELFAMSSSGTGLVQLTNDTASNGGSIYYAALAGSGNRVAFV